MDDQDAGATTMNGVNRARAHKADATNTRIDQQLAAQVRAYAG
jgi:hypothetical protein